jgi:hypothetical protein
MNQIVMIDSIDLKMKARWIVNIEIRVIQMIRSNNPVVLRIMGMYIK